MNSLVDPTYFPSDVHLTHGNITAFGIFMMAITLAFLIYSVIILIRHLHVNYRGCCHYSRDKMYYKLMGEIYELRKEYKRDIADLKELINELCDESNKESNE